MTTVANTPDGWSVIPLSDCVDILDSRRKPVNSKERAKRNGPIPYYGATGQVGWIDDFLFDEELLLLGEDGAPFLDKSKPIAYIIRGKSWVNNHAHVLRAKPDVTSNGYLKHYLDSFDFTHFVAGSTRDKLTQRQMRAIPVLLPSLPEQNHLVRVLDQAAATGEDTLGHLAASTRALERFRLSAVAAACSGKLTASWRNEREVSSTGDLVTSARERRRLALGRRFKEPVPNPHFTRPELPETWVPTTLGLLVESIKYGTSVRSDYGIEGTAVLRIPNVSAGLDLNDLKYAALRDRELSDLSLREGDLLMIRSNGSPQLVGKTVVVSKEAAGLAYAGYLVRLRTDPLVIDYNYLALALASPQVRQQIEMPLRSTSGVNNINTEEIRSLVIPLPPSDEQREVARVTQKLLDASDGIAARVGEASERAAVSRNAFLAQAFRGALTEAAA